MCQIARGERDRIFVGMENWGAVTHREDKMESPSFISQEGGIVRYATDPCYSRKKRGDE